MTITDPVAASSGRAADTLRVVLVDDHQLLAESLAMALHFEGVACTVPTLGDRDSLVRTVLEAAPHLVLLDLDLGGDIGDGTELVGPFVEAGSRVLVITGSTDHDRTARALELGAAGVVRKDVAFSVLLEATLAAARGEDVMEPVARRRMLEEARTVRLMRSEELAPFQRLSAREAQVLRALARGQSVATIAEAWFVSEATVRSQVRSILAKLNLSSQLEAVAAAYGSGWIRDSRG